MQTLWCVLPIAAATFDVQNGTYDSCFHLLCGHKIATCRVEKERHFAKMIVKMVTSKSHFKKFLSAIESDCQSILAKCQTAKNFDHGWAFRILHTIEGEAGTFGLEQIRLATRLPQEALEPLKNGTGTFDGICEDFVVEVKNLLKIKNQFLSEHKDLFEAVGVLGADTTEVTEEQIQQCFSYLKQKNVELETIQFVENLLLSRPVSSLFRHYEDLALSIAEKCGKKLNKIRWHGMEQSVRLEPLGPLAASFVHVFRNMVDHGIEPPEDRVMLGKPEAGQINFYFQTIERNGEEYFCIRAEDDGQGIHAEVVRAKLEKMGKAVPANVPDEELIQSVFESGFSTRTTIGEFSGRGIGMNAVMEEAIKLGGTARIESIPGAGTKVIVEVPAYFKDQSLRRSA